MKKFSILALAALLVVAFALPAAALENEFGGYWRTRFFNQGFFDGEKNDDSHLRSVDTRTRLYYTAKINDNLKFVNKFEMDAVWGENETDRARVIKDVAGSTLAVLTPSLYGDTGADGVRVEVKNSYADFNTGPVNWTVGVQPYALFRSFHIDGDASGVIARWKIMDNFVLAGSWLKAFESRLRGQNNQDVDAYTLTGAFWFSENISIKPSFSWSTSSDASGYFTNADPAGDFIGVGVLSGSFFDSAPLDAFYFQSGVRDWDQYTYGLDFDATFDGWGLFATVFGQDATLKTPLYGDVDQSGWLLNVGGNVMLGPVDLHAEAIYTPGDSKADNKLKQVFSPLASHYWAEIMGLGVFDQRASAGSPADLVTNLMAFNIGASMSPMDKLKVAVDLWYAEREEDIFLGTDPLTGLPIYENELGTELDVRVTYELVEGLNLDLIGAYLWAGDATSLDGKNDKDPYELGAQLSLSF